MGHPLPVPPHAAQSARPLEPVTMYVGDVMHQRMKPVGHRFRYKVFSLLIDLDRLAEADRVASLFSVNRRNIVSFHETDHLRGAQAPDLRSHIDDLLARAGVAERCERLLLACYPRIFGQVFNPLSVYYAYGRTGELVAMVYQVRNTFGEHHTYVCPIIPGEATSAGIRQSRTKVFYVSPFIDLGMRYHFRMNIPGDRLSWRILETDASGPLLAATYSGLRRPLTSQTLLKCLLQIPMLTWKIVGGIHFEALKLWFKGMRYIHRPAPPPKASFQDETGFGQPGD